METMQNNEQEQILEAEKQKKNETFKKTLILLGIFAALILAMILTVVFVPRGIDSVKTISISSLFKAKEKIVVTADRTEAVSGERIMLKWNGDVRNDGSYTVTYPCKNGVSAQFHSGEPIACDVAFFFFTPDNTVAVKLFSSLDRDTDVPLYLNFKDNEGQTTLVGDALITLRTSAPRGTNTNNNGSTVTVVTTPSTNTNTNTNTSNGANAKPVTPKPTTKPAVTGVDLAVRVISIGSISASNTFTPGATVPAGSRPAIRFEVINLGQTNSGTWNFKVNSPSPTTPVYYSSAQPTLANGDRVEYTFGFDNSTNGGTVVISVNENKQITETTYANNVYSYSVSGNSNNTPVSTGTGKDLTVQFTSVGYMSNGTFIPTYSIPRSARAVVKFVVTNTGNEATGNYTFTADLPSTTDSSYTSNVQTSLGAGQSMEYTLAFDNIRNTGSNAATVRVDSGSQVSETNENNNSASTYFTAYQ